MTNDFDSKDPKITAYALDELNSSEKAEIEKLIEESDDAQRAVREIRMTVGLLTEEFQNEAKPSLTETHRQLIEKSLDQQNAIEPASPKRKTNRSRRRVSAWMTACLLLVVASAWAFRSGLFESRRGSDTNIVAVNDNSNLNRMGILSEDRLELKSSKREMMESSKSDFPKKDAGQNSRGEIADDQIKKQPLSMFPPSKPIPESKIKDRGVTAPPGKSESENLIGGGSGFSHKGSSKNTKSREALENNIRQESLIQQAIRKRNQKPSNTLNLMRSKSNRQQQRRSRPRRAFKKDFYLGLKLQEDSRKRNRTLDPQSAGVPPARKNISDTKSGKRNSGKGYQGRQNKPINFKNDKKAGSNDTKLFKKKSELGKNLKFRSGKLEEKSKEIDDSNRDKDVKPIDNQEKDSPEEFVVENEFLSAMRYPNSSFPLAVANISLAEISQYIEKGMLPPPSLVRIEEMLNHFEYSDNNPTINTGLFNIAIESGPCPWNRNHTLIRVGIKVKNAKPNTTNLQIIARNVSVQFNPAKISRHRLIGYDYAPLALKNSEGVDGLVAGSSVIALYEIVPTRLLAIRGEQRLKELLKNKYVAAPKLIDRLKHTNELLSVELFYYVGENRIQSLTVPHVPTKGTTVSKEFQWASAVAMYGLLLRDSYYLGDANLDLVKKLATGSRGNDKHGRRKQFLELVEKTIKPVNQQPRE